MANTVLKGKENHKNLTAPVNELPFALCQNDDSEKQMQESDMVVNTCNPSTLEAEAGGSEFEASLVYIERVYPKKRKEEKKDID
jgi:hypothetical protein